MGKFYTAKFPGTDISRIDQVSSWFNAFDGITSEVVTVTVDNIDFVGAKVSIDGTDIEMFLGDVSGTVTRSHSYIKNGDAVLASNTVTSGGSETGINVSAYIDEKCILLCACQNLNGPQVMYTRAVGGDYLIGYKANVNGNTNIIDDISSMTFEKNGDTSRTPYTYANMFPYYADGGVLDFLSESYFKNGLNYKSFTSDILKECSTVSLLSTVSLPDPLGSHMAIGAHCIVPVDINEEVSE